VREGKKALLFVNKKKQKNFVNLGCVGFTAMGPKSQKFLRRFFQKAATSFSKRSILLDACSAWVNPDHICLGEP
jgi:hypothetical protein